MEIKCGKYTIKSDKWNFWIEETRKVDEKKRKKKDGDDERDCRVTGYFLDWQDLMHDFNEQKLRSSDAKTVKEILETVNEAKKETEMLIKKLPSIRREK